MQSFHYVDSFSTNEKEINSWIFYFFHLNFHNIEIQAVLLLRLQLKIHSVVHENAMWAQSKARSYGLDKVITFVK